MGFMLIVEPNIRSLPNGLTGNIALSSVKSVVDEADIILLLVDHKQFRDLPLDWIGERIVLDMRGVWFK